MTERNGENPEPKPDRDSRGLFVRGNSLGAKGGRPRGSRSKTQELARVLEGCIDEQGMQAVILRLHTAALTGDVSAIGLLLSYAYGKPRAAAAPPPLLELPSCTSPKGCVQAAAQVVAAVADGRIDAHQANVLSTAIESSRRALETVEVSERVEHLEARAEQEGRF